MSDERPDLPPMPPEWMPATEAEVSALREDVNARMLPIALDLAVLARHGALGGVAEIIAERKRLAEQRGEVPGKPNLCYAAETELDLGNYARAAALLAAEIDRENREEAP